MKELFLSYDDIHRMCQKIATDIEQDTWVPECIVAISGGGLIPARILRLFLKVPIYTISVKRYDDTEAFSPVPQITQWLDNPAEQIGGKNILIVDEVDDTRVTLAFCVEHLEKDVPASMRIAVLTQKNKPKEATLPASAQKMYAAQDIEDVWVNHPWESRDIDQHNNGVRI